MVHDSKNLQNIFLNHLRKHKVQVTIFLHNGVKLQGVITWFDSFCLLLRRYDSQQLVYKHAVATVMPRLPIELNPGGERDDMGEERHSHSHGYEDEPPEDW